MNLYSSCNQFKAGNINVTMEINRYMHICHLIHALTFLVVAAGAHVLIEIKQDRIALGKPLKISCEMKDETVTGNRIWKGGKSSGLLSFEGVSTNPEKYHEDQLSDAKYQLTINNVTEDDINCLYGCRFGFKSAEVYVNADKYNFINLPTENMIDTGYVKNDQIFILSVKFYNVYPVPSCSVKLESKSKNLAKVNKTQSGLLHDVQFLDQSEEPYHLCDHPVHIECYFGKTEYLNHYIKHDVSCSRPNEDNILLSVGVGVPVALIVIAVIVPAVLCHKRRHRRQLRKNRNLKVEESQSFSYLTRI